MWREIQGPQREEEETSVRKSEEPGPREAPGGPWELGLRAQSEPVGDD